jgi:predicted SnoaL-like aldol condensation-catalyzing enzyme
MRAPSVLRVLRSRLAPCLVALLLGAGASAQLPVEVHPNQTELLASDDPALAANKKLVFDFWREVLQAHQVERAPAYLAEDYVQHNPTIATGRAAFMDFFGRLPRATVKPTIDELVAIVAERDLVVLAFRRELPDLENEGQTYTTTWFDMFRIADGKIVEHWDYGTKD